MKNIAIVGAGISGLYIANLLQNDPNYNFTIYEKRSKPDINDGYGIQLSANSIKLLNEIGFKNIPTHEGEHVSVILMETDGKDSVCLIRAGH